MVGELISLSGYSDGGSLKYSLAHLLLIFPAWAFAYIVAPYAATQNDRFTYRHDVESASIRNYRSWAIYYSDASGRKFVNDRLANRWADIVHDCDQWGNKYQLVEHDEHDESWPPSPSRDETQVHEFPSPYHVYSFGEDGKSDTNGNDPDDINSWNYDRNTFYGRQIANEMKRKYLWRTLWLTPIIYLALCVVVHRFKSSQPIAR